MTRNDLPFFPGRSCTNQIFPLFDAVNNGNNSIQLTIENLAAGEYVVKITIDEGVVIGSFVKN